MGLNKLKAFKINKLIKNKLLRILVSLKEMRKDKKFEIKMENPQSEIVIFLISDIIARGNN